MSKTLRMIFGTAGGRSVAISVPEPVEPVNETTLADCMDKIVDSNIFDTTSGDITEKVRAEVVERTVDTVWEPSEE